MKVAGLEEGKWGRKGVGLSLQEGNFWGEEVFQANKGAPAIREGFEEHFRRFAWHSPADLVVKNPLCNAGDLGSNPGWGTE